MDNVPKVEQYFDFSPHGIFFSILVMFFLGIAFMFGILYHQQSLVNFSLILLILSVMLRIWSRLSVKHVHYTATVDKPFIFPFETVKFTITIENNKFLPIIVKLRLVVPGVLKQGLSEFLISETSGILWFQKRIFHQKLKPIKRGVYKIGTPRLVTGDFFGFFPKIKTVQQDIELTVFPRIVPLRPFLILKRIMFGKPASISPVQDPIYTLGTRNYQALSPAKNIHWKASARHNKLQEMIFEPTEQEKILLILETDGFVQNSAEQLFEQTIEILISLAIDLDAQHYSIGFLTNSQQSGVSSSYLSFNRGVDQISNLLDRSARIQMEVGCKMDQLLMTKQYFQTGLSCIYFSHDPSDKIAYLFQQKIPVMNVVSRSENQQENPMNETSSGLRYCYLTDIGQDENNG